MNIELVKRWLANQAEEAAAKEEVKRITAEGDAIEATLLEQFFDDGITSLAVDGMTVYITNPVRAKKANDGVEREDIVEALIVTGHGDIAPRSFNWNTLTSLCRELTEEGRELPEALANVIEVSTISALGKRKK